MHFTLYNISYYDDDDDDYYYYYILVDLYIALENILFTFLPDVSSFLHILLQRYTIPEQYTCTGSRFSGQFAVLRRVTFFYLSKSKSNCSQNYLSKSKSIL